MKTDCQAIAKKVLILGIGKSGSSTARTLHKIGIPFILSDNKEMKDCPDLSELAELAEETYFGDHSFSLTNMSVDLIIKSPGIPYSNAILLEAKMLNVPIVTEVEIAYLLSDAKIVGITGSNGKTTTTSLAGSIFELSGLSSEIGGNIGSALIDHTNRPELEWLISELSSFQLEGTIKFRPHIACFLNFSETHLDYHKTKENYLSAKLNLFKNQLPTDYAILNYDDLLFHNVASNIRSQIYWFSIKEEVEKGVFIKNGDVIYRDNNKVETLFPLSEIQIKGSHNIENTLAAVLIACLANIDTESIRLGVRTFKTVQHRLEYIGSKGNVEFYNDSKSTNPTSTNKACDSFEQPIILIAGGKERHADFDTLRHSFSKSNFKGIVTFGETKEKLLRVAENYGVAIALSANNVNEAVALAEQISSNGDVILFSPACASWDMYNSFEERGNDFIKAYTKLKKRSE